MLCVQEVYTKRKKTAVLEHTKYSRNRDHSAETMMCGPDDGESRESLLIDVGCDQ